ncbi:MAG: hypothetical protein WBD40_01815 [Tepidisphaeraceae bacterium]
MRHRPFHLLALLLLLALVGAKEVPSAPELRQMLMQKQYKSVLREVARAMAIKGDEAANYDRGELLLIRGEAQLGLRIEPGAAKSFRESAEAAMDDDTRAQAQAMGLLLEKSEHLLYTPRTGEAMGREIHIVTDRKGAIDALLADELLAAAARIAAARTMKEIAPVMDVTRAVDQVAAVERAATGTSTKAGEFRKELASRIETLLDDALLAMEVRADKIESAALGLVVIPQAPLPPGQPEPPAKLKKRGITPGDEASLREIMDTCAEVVSRSREVAVQLGAEPDRFRRATDSAIRLSAKAGSILRASYAGVIEQPEPEPKAPPAAAEQVPKQE